MNEEEKKAVEYLTKYIHWETFGERHLETDIQTTLNLIEKLQKENEELKEVNEELSENKLLQDIEIKKNFIPIQKIKDKIEELKSKSGGNFISIQQIINAEIQVLQELLEK